MTIGTIRNKCMVYRFWKLKITIISQIFMWSLTKLGLHYRVNLIVMSMYFYFVSSMDFILLWPSIYLPKRRSSVIFTMFCLNMKLDLSLNWKNDTPCIYYVWYI